MDSNLVTTGVILFGIWYMTMRNKVSLQPLGPGQVTTIPTSPLTPPISPPPPPPNRAPLSGTCFGVTDQGYPPYLPNIKNPCQNNTYGWTLVQNPRKNQCQAYVGPDYVDGLGGCILPNQPGGSKVMFLLVNSGK